MNGINSVVDYYIKNPLIFNAIFHTFQRGDQLVCPPGESLENMLILQDTINDERNRRSSDAAGPTPAAAPGPAPTPTASQNNHEPQGQFAGCSQPSIIPNPASTSSVRRISAVYVVSINSKNKSNLENISLRFLWRIGEGGIPSQRNSKGQGRVRVFSFLCPIIPSRFHHEGNCFSLGDKFI